MLSRKKNLCYKEWCKKVKKKTHLQRVKHYKMAKIKVFILVFNLFLSYDFLDAVLVQ